MEAVTGCLHLDGAEGVDKGLIPSRGGFCLAGVECRVLGSGDTSTKSRSGGFLVDTSMRSGSGG